MKEKEGETTMIEVFKTSRTKLKVEAVDKSIRIRDVVKNLEKHL